MLICLYGDLLARASAGVVERGLARCSFGKTICLSDDSAGDQAVPVVCSVRCRSCPCDQVAVGVAARAVDVVAAALAHEAAVTLCRFVGRLARSVFVVVLGHQTFAACPRLNQGAGHAEVPQESQPFSCAITTLLKNAMTASCAISRSRFLGIPWVDRLSTVR